MANTTLAGIHVSRAQGYSIIAIWPDVPQVSLQSSPTRVSYVNQLAVLEAFSSSLLGR